MEDGIKEAFSICKGGVVYSGKPPSAHVEKEYTILKDETFEGMRTIVLQEKDLTQLHKKVQKIVDTIAEKIDESESRVVKELLFDVLKDYEEKRLDTLYKQIVEKGEPVKAKEGCYKIIVRDGRTKKSEHIMLRE